MPGVSWAASAARSTPQSSEEGLEAGFNSLQAQRKPASLYPQPASRGLGIARTRYDDAVLGWQHAAACTAKLLATSREAGSISSSSTRSPAERSLADFARWSRSRTPRACRRVGDQQFNTPARWGG